MRRCWIIVFTLAAAGCSSSSQQIECPIAETGKVAGSLQETTAQLKSASNSLGGGDENQIAGSAARVRAHHPDATKVQIVDYLVTAYCPRINANYALDMAGKRQVMRTFAARAERIVELTGRTS